MARHLIIGASHAIHLAQAMGPVEADREAASRGALPISVTGTADTWKLLLLTHQRPFLTFHPGARGIEVRADPVLLEDLACFDAPDSRIVCLIGGNEHNAQFMIAHPQPFDLVHPRGPAPQPGRQIVPAAVIRRTLAQSLEFARLALVSLGELFPNATRHVVAPPPPIPSDAQIRGSPESFEFGQRRVESAAVRLKIYETLLDVLAGIAAGSGCVFMAPPASRRDAQGFLAQPYWLGATHATPTYYEPVIAALGVQRHASV